MHELESVVEIGGGEEYIPITYINASGAYTPVIPVPEPADMLLLGLTGSLALFRRRRLD